VIGYYPGCALHGTSSEYEMSVRAVAEALSHRLQEIDDWNCCGASAAHMTNRTMATCLSLRNLALARKQGIDAVFAPCPMCSKELLAAAEAAAESEQARQRYEQIIENQYDGGVRVLNYIQYLFDIVGLDALQQRVTNPLNDLKVACYYGCLLTRPPGLVQFDDCEQPSSFERVVRTLGAEPVDFPLKTERCGGGFTQSNAPSVGRLSGMILRTARSAGADAVAVACPMCQMNLDMRQSAAEKQLGEQLNMPVVYLSQLVGLGVGVGRKKLGLDRHFVSTAAIGPASADAPAEKKEA
jgi:heterodisulfide reductase subunit B